MRIIKERFGSHVLKIEYRGDDFAQVRVDDLSNLKFPMLFSLPMSYEMANYYLDIFRNCGYVPIVELDNYHNMLY